MPLTSGTVSYETGRKSPEEFAPATKARIEISFVVNETENFDALISLAKVAARRNAEELLGILAPSAPATASSPGAAPSVTEALDGLIAGAKEAEEVKAGKGKSGRPKKGEGKNEPVAAPAPAVFEMGSTQKPEAPAADPQAALDAMLAGSAPVKEYTDQELFKIVVEVNTKLKNPPVITGVIKEFCPNDGVQPAVSRIPAEKREEFVAKLRSL
jgi:hypothetical protein